MLLGGSTTKPDVDVDLMKGNGTDNAKLVVDVPRDLCNVFPRIPRSVFYMTEVWIKRNYAVDQNNTPLLHFAHQQVGLWLLDIQHKIQIKKFSQLLVVELFESLWELNSFTYTRCEDTGYKYASTYRTISVLLSEFAVQVAHLNGIPPTDFQRISGCLLKQRQATRNEKLIPDTRVCPTVEDFKEERILGAGGFGVVYRVRYAPGNFVCVVKLVPIKSFPFLRHSTADRVVAAVTDHPLIATYFCCFETSDMVIGAMEYVRGVTLENVVNYSRTLPLRVSRMLFSQIVAGLMHLHFNGVIYRDLKPSNVMILEDGKIKLIDFETSRICRGHFPKKRSTIYFGNTSVEFDDGEKAGTLPFMAPEVIDQRAYGRAADWWSAGVVLFKMYTGRLPFRANDETGLREVILTRPVTFPKLSKGVKLIKKESIWREHNVLSDTIQELLEKNPFERLGSENYDTILANPFLETVDWKSPSRPSPLITGALEERSRLNDNREISILCGKDPKKLNLLGLESLKGYYTFGRYMLGITEKSNVLLPLNTYVSKFFREIHMKGTASWSGSTAPLLKEFSDTAETFGGIQADEKDGDMEKLEIIVPKGTGFAIVSSVGLQVGSTMGENKKTYFFVKKLAGIAAKSGLVLGDIILEINGASVVDKTWMEFERKLMFCSDFVYITVMTSSPYRLCKSRKDMSSVADLYPLRSATLPAFKEGLVGCILARSRKIEVRPCGFYNEAKDTFVQLFSIWNVDSSFVEGIYHGDFLIAIDGEGVSEMSEQEVNRILNTNSRERTVTVIPMSCLRENRPCFDRSLNIYEKPPLQTPDSTALGSP